MQRDISSSFPSWEATRCLPKAGMAAQLAHFGLHDYLAITLCCVPARAGLGDGRPRLGISHEDQMMMALSSVVSSWMHVVIWQAEMEKRDANGGS